MSNPAGADTVGYSNVNATRRGMLLGSAAAAANLAISPTAALAAQPDADPSP